ncbi:peptidase [Lacticaseibacillus paracasei]|nr:peptidase [Lacticaseibacillus paracasei]
MRNLLHEEVNAMLITVLLLIVLYLVRQHSLATRCFHCLLAVLSGLSIHTWLTFLLASGLIIFSVADWHERTVPFFSFTGWCLTLLVCFPHDLFGMMLLAVLIGGLAVVSQGLGSADVMLIALLACVLRLEAALIVTLIACGTACLHWIAARPPSLPMISHLAAGYACFALVNGIL